MPTHRESLVFCLSSGALCAIGSTLIAASMAHRSAPGGSVASLVDGAPAAECLGQHVEPTAVPGFTYIGVSGCMGPGCHNEQAANHGGKMVGDEYSIWSDSDPHSRAFDSLIDNDLSDTIATKLGMESGSAPDSPRCASCHTTHVPENQQGPKFDPTRGVGCETCHGPAEKYLDPHATEGWTSEQRGKIGATGLLADYGMIDTTQLAGRAQMCVSCHLQIDKDMLDAGHPALQFEMWAYNFYVYDGQPHKIHWDDTHIEFINAKLWAVGQAASLQQSRKQVENWKSKSWNAADAEALVAMYAAGADIAKKHFGADTVAALAGAKYSAEACKAAALDLAALAPSAKTRVERRNIGFGMVALGQSYLKSAKGEVPADFWPPYADATGGEPGQAWIDAINKLAKVIEQ